jgi:hypothetical protein
MILCTEFATRSRSAREGRVQETCATALRQRYLSREHRVVLETALIRCLNFTTSLDAATARLEEQGAAAANEATMAYAAECRARASVVIAAIESTSQDLGVPLSRTASSAVHRMSPRDESPRRGSPAARHPSPARQAPAPRQWSPARQPSLRQQPASPRLQPPSPRRMCPPPTALLAMSPSSLMTSPQRRDRSPMAFR